MELNFILLIMVIVVVALYDFTNGFHDAADMVATAIASGAMKTSIAIIIAGFFTFLGPLIMGLAVADTVGTFVNIEGVQIHRAQSLVIGALLAAITYNLITWKLGYPSSSSNSLAGGLVGAGLALLGNQHVNWGIEAMLNGQLEGVMKVVVGLFASPFLGLLIGFLLMKLILKLFQNFTYRVRNLFVISQYFSVAWLGFSHGANDAQKGMAIIGMMLLASGQTQNFEIPLWAILLCTTAITLGTFFGGWSIIKTLGFEIYRVRVVHSVANQLSASLVNTLATMIGAPTSTTQVVTATLIGNGAAEKPRHVNWLKAKGIVTGWFLNVPISMALGALYATLIFTLFGGSHV
ncbi:inorganic phosphate transporter [Thiomicrorhabdus heinhorstiae]|uniref:Inorganic phosphate transporter n=1 Tax=Thiomicrorhabdus heinhorstiae TaxID=2748010 RepID=A0ABS0BYI4_9GAMM|nr:inorganic phosphate transporter [Thiomicrorhabdus heinhorstiae]MBF6058858.1 inorganic phosphate transporter [Thiomicrorhabdus heinhorstiae]